MALHVKDFEDIVGEDLNFEDDSQISISLRPTDHIGAEALEMSTRDKRLIIIRIDTDIAA